MKLHPGCFEGLPEDPKERKTLNIRQRQVEIVHTQSDGTVNTMEAEMVWTGNRERFQLKLPEDHKINHNEHVSTVVCTVGVVTVTTKLVTPKRVTPKRGTTKRGTPKRVTPKRGRGADEEEEEEEEETDSRMVSCLCASVHL
jgi:hypothetical protein